jgi:hypothetical protein
MDGDRKPKPFLQTQFSLGYPEFSPDGRWLAYVSADSGRAEVYVQAYPTPGEKIRISPDGGQAPVWNRNQRELFFIRPSSGNTQFWVVDVETTKDFRIGKPHLLFEGPYGGTTPLRNFDVTPDGQRFIMPKESGSTREGPFTQMHIVLNWIEELKRRVPAGK